MLNVLFESGASLFDSILVVWFITRFTGKSFDPKKNRFWIPAVLIIFGFTIFSDRFLQGFNIISTGIHYAMYVCYGLAVAWDKKIRAIISATAFEAAIVLLGTFLFTAASFFIKDFAVLMQGTNNIVRYLTVLLHKITLFSVCKILLALFRDKRDPDFRNGIFSALYSLISVVGVAAATVVSATANDPRSQLAVLIEAAAFILGNVVFYVLVGQLLRLQKEKYDLEFVENMMRYEHKTYEQASKVWDDARKSRHDMKQHLNLIKDYLESDERDKCLDYVKKLLPSVENPHGTVIRSDSKVIDYVINSKLAGRDDIDLLISGSLGDISDIDEPDLVSILGNILDNALEALAGAEKKELELIFFTQNNNRSIICKNSIPQSVLTDNKELSSTKKDRKRHGLGTKIVRQEAEKYGGLVDYYEEISTMGNLMFCVQVMLPKI